MAFLLSAYLPAAAQFQTQPGSQQTLSSGLSGQSNRLEIAYASEPSAKQDANAVPGLGGNALAQPSLPMRPDMGAVDSPKGTPGAMAQPMRPFTQQEPSQFQRFVQQSTGRLLPHFGADLFNNPQAYAVDAAIPAPSEYVLGQGDEVRIQIWGAIDYAGIQSIDRNGQISLPKIGTINLSGVQLKDLEATLRKRVATVFNNFSLNASLGKLRGITVYVVGQAQQPGTYNLSSLSTLVNAVFASGGPGVNGSMRGIQLKRAGKTVTTLDLYDFIGKGDKTRDAPLQPGDVIMIPPAGPRVAIVGAYDHAAIYEINADSTVKDLLALGGGVPALASSQKALVESIGQASKTPRTVRNIALDAVGLSHVLKDGDILTLLPISAAFANAVTLQGTVAQPLRHPWFEGMRVSDLIPDRDALLTPDYYKRKNQLVQTLRAPAYDDLHTAKDFKGKSQGLPTRQVEDPEKDPQAAGSRTSQRVRSMVDQINWDYAVIERLNPQELSTELIPFNLGKAVNTQDPQHNLALRPGDVLTVMSSADLRLPSARQTRLVRVEGEVKSPGIYPVKPGETLPQIIARIGGLTPQAYLFGTEFTRETVRQQQQKNLDKVIQQLETQAQNANANLTANLTGERASQANALQQQQQAQLRSQIDKLKIMRSQGRVSLELDPAALGMGLKVAANPNAQNAVIPDMQKALSTLPNLPLEDGDSILVPSLPAFVSAAGSVNNENVIIFKTGRTVGDILQSAGLREEADPSEAFLLRADGSVISRRGAGFFNSFESTALMPGDTVIVPAKADRESGYNFLVRALRDWTQIFSNLGIGAAAIKTLRN